MAKQKAKKQKKVVEKEKVRSDQKKQDRAPTKLQKAQQKKGKK